jgi:hypothetical protein
VLRGCWGSRQWRDEERVMALLQEKLCSDTLALRKLITSTQARDILSGDPAWQ